MSADALCEGWWPWVQRKALTYADIRSAYVRHAPGAVEDLAKLRQAVLRSVRAQRRDGFRREEVFFKTPAEGVTSVRDHAVPAGAAELAADRTCRRCTSSSQQGSVSNQQQVGYPWCSNVRRVEPATSVESQTAVDEVQFISELQTFPLFEVLTVCGVVRSSAGASTVDATT